MEPGKNFVCPQSPQVFTIEKPNMRNTPLHQASKHDLELSKHNQGMNSGFHWVQTGKFIYIAVISNWIQV